jgi:hypothetical protein
MMNFVATKQQKRSNDSLQQTYKYQKGKYHKCMVENVTMLLTCLLTSKTTNLNRMKDDMARISTVKNL